MKKISLFLLGTAVSFLTVPALAQSPGCNAPSSAQVANQTQDIVVTADSAGQFSTLLAALKAAGLSDTLKGAGPFTVFAPTDEAFKKLPPGTLEALLKDKQKLQAILTYHVVSGNLQAADVLAGAQLKTLQGQSLEASSQGGSASVNQAKILTTDIECSNGVIHVIDTVLLPK